MLITIQDHFLGKFPQILCEFASFGDKYVFEEVIILENEPQKKGIRWKFPFKFGSRYHVYHLPTVNPYLFISVIFALVIYEVVTRCALSNP